jgi:RNA-directed DNA polymerase
MPPESGEDLIRKCAKFVGLTSNEVLAIARTGPLRYKIYEIRKRSGGVRVIAQPSRELKQLQYFFLKEVLPSCAVHESAAAYVIGRSIRDNASQHSNSRVILKLDFERFFPSITVMAWRKFVEDKFPSWNKVDLAFSEHVLFFGNRIPVPMFLSIGAPTSPMISNALMYEFDCELAKYCADRGLTYTRYADDITISTNEFLDQAETIRHVISVLAALKYPRVRLNATKTHLYSKRHNRTVTGLVLANDGSVSLGRQRKREISALIHRFGVGILPAVEVPRLRGLIAFAMDAEPSFVRRLRAKYGSVLIDRILGTR